MSLYLFVAAAAALLFWRWRSDPLRSVPGPWLARWTPFWLMYHARRGERYLAVHEAHRKYGPVVRIAPWHVSFATPEAPGRVYAQGSAALDKSPFYRAFYVQGNESLFSTQNRALHASKRRLLSQPFSYQSIRGFEGFIRESLGRFVHRLDAVCNGERFGDAVRPGRSIDVLLWFNYLAFDIISDLAFGEPLGMVNKGSDLLPAEHKDGTVFEEHAAALIDQRGRTAAVVGLLPSIEDWTKKLPISFVQAGYQSTESLSRIATRCVKHRLQSGVTRDDMLERLIEGVREKQGGGEVSEEEVVTEAMLLLTAGADTTANSLTAILYYILTHPQVYRKLIAELETINAPVGELATSEKPPLRRLESKFELEAATEGLPTHEQVKTLPYLNAVIEEGLRMFATNAFGLPRVTGPDGFDMDGWTLPPGVEVSAPAYTIQRDPRIWGADADEYRPERWLEEGGGALKKHMMTFGQGPRACIGKNLAYIQMQLALVTALLRYEFVLPPNAQLRSVEGFMHKPVELWVGIRRRGFKA
ncbi:cytochrome P450 [Exidia glandulosa HHB12029]|uniref:Cytochrome P450 n=1 Tax=Exidia glandulosa HHB12029 TaxID=1314781 RepID=A0A165IDD8_EXIGL|nr:cytochrome P450 [Exidia glandulosa HHB12029]